METKNIVFDIGGTNMRVAVATKDAFGEIRKIPTPKNPQLGMQELEKIARELGAGNFSAGAGCIAGRVSVDGVLSDARNLREWEGVNIVQGFSRVLGVPVQAYNDAIIVGLGEAECGAGKGFNSVAYITVSTGVGGARVDKNDLAHSPLLGDLSLSTGDLESQVSGTAVQKKFGIHPKDLDSLEERNNLADILAAGLIEIRTAWKPDIFVLGGSMIVGKNPIPLERVRETAARLGSPLAVTMAALGDNGGLEGGRVLANRMA